MRAVAGKYWWIQMTGSMNILENCPRSWTRGFRLIFCVSTNLISLTLIMWGRSIGIVCIFRRKIDGCLSARSIGDRSRSQQKSIGPFEFEDGNKKRDWFFVNQSLKKSAYSVNDHTDPFIDQSGDQGNDKSFHQVKWSNCQEHEGPYVADRRVNGCTGSDDGV